MVISFDAALQQAKNALPHDLEPVIAKSKWIAYKNGKVVGESSISHRDAMTSFNTQIIERVVANQNEVDAYNEQQQRIYRMASSLWNASLREEYSGISNKVFELCFEYALDHDSYGHDVVAEKMERYVEFAERVLSLQQQ